MSCIMLQSDLVKSTPVSSAFPSLDVLKIIFMVNVGTTHYLRLQCAIYALSMVVVPGTNVALLTGVDCISDSANWWCSLHGANWWCSLHGANWWCSLHGANWWCSLQCYALCGHVPDGVLQADNEVVIE